MSINNLFTAITQTGQPPIGFAPGAGITQPGGDLFALFLSQFQTTAQASQNPRKAETGPLQSDNPALAKDPQLNIAELLAATPDIEKAINALPQDQKIALLKALTSDQQEALEQTLALNQIAFDSILKPATPDSLTATQAESAIAPAPLLDLLNVNAAEQGAPPAPTVLQNLIDRLKAVLAKLEDGRKLETPVTLNLTPQDTAALIGKIKAALQHLENLAKDNVDTALANADESAKTDDLVDLILGLNIAGILHESSKAAPHPGVNNIPKPATLAARLQTAAPGGEAATISADSAAQDESARLARDFANELDGIEKDAGKLAAQAKTQSKVVLAQALIAVPNPAPQLRPGMPHTPAPFPWADWSQEQFDYLGAVPWNNTAGSFVLSYDAAMMPTSRAGAYLPHAAMQTVASHISRAAAKGDDTMFRIQLEPPELGRIDIKMSFGKDKTVKAVVTAEKPETFMMLQRDSHVLERSLQQAGLDAHGALSFALADDNNAFSQNGGHDGHRQQAQSQNANTDDAQIIESIMTWQIDPASGHMRYNILA